MCLLSIFLEMQMRHQLLSSIVFLNDDLHKQKQFMYTLQLMQLSAVVNHRLGDKYNVLKRRPISYVALILALLTE